MYHVFLYQCNITFGGKKAYSLKKIHSYMLRPNALRKADEWAREFDLILQNFMYHDYRDQTNQTLDIMFYYIDKNWNDEGIFPMEETNWYFVYIIEV